tara:strand:+ start:256 stop:471 length:216 start_codon:yes stop_codon:yes gene_type:complete
MRWVYQLKSTRAFGALRTVLSQQATAQPCHGRVIFMARRQRRNRRTARAIETGEETAFSRDAGMGCCIIQI